MATRWTDEQLNAIENNGGTLLVSAAAGSGKTAVLVERVLRKVMDEENPKDIDSFLIVTYTNAAAAELRGKLFDALSARLAQFPDDKRLSRQLFLVHKAKIMTVHAFCLSLIRENFVKIGISNDFRILSDAEAKPVKNEILTDLIEKMYDEQSNQNSNNFLLLSDLVSQGQDDRQMHEVIMDTYAKIQSHANPKKFLQKVNSDFENPIDDMATTVYGRILLDEVNIACKYGKLCLTHAIELMTEVDEVADKYLPAFTVDLNYADALINITQSGSWDEAVSFAQNINLVRLSPCKYEDKDFLETLKSLREQWKIACKKITEKFLSITTEQVVSDREKIAPSMTALVGAVNEFSDLYSSYKRRKNVVDFNDLEHFAISLLYNDDGITTDIAKDVSNSLTEVLVDEYQDTNEVQDAIFNAVSNNGKKLFMVGDIKQSIYSFRLANPYIFLNKYNNFADSDKAVYGQPRRVVLSKNFRSRHQVLNATNGVFEKVMSSTLGDVDYGEREALYAGANYPDSYNPCYNTELCVIDTSTDGEKHNNTQIEAKTIANRISKMIADGFLIFDKKLDIQRKILPSDCTILLRSISNKASVFAQELEKVGLSVQMDQKSGLLKQVEVRAIISLLNCIDNPRQDIELIATLRSPIINFSKDLLAKIRIIDKNISFYEALCKYSEENKQCEDFLTKLNSWRTLAADLSVWRLIELIFDETNALGIYGAMPNGMARQANLLALFERAQAYEQQGHKGLFKFMCLIRGMLENDEDFETANVQADGGAVRIMSIHKSKGLEFPVVFLADCAKTFNEGDLRDTILVHSELGFGPKCRETEKGISYTTLWRQSIIAKMRHEQVSEELRILYVAMTRARDKLIITCASSSLKKKIKDYSMLSIDGKLSPYALGEARSYSLWLLCALIRHEKAHELRELAEIVLTPDTSLPDCFDFSVVRADDIASETQTINEENADDFSFDSILVPDEFVYQNKFLCDIPAKLTASELKSKEQIEITAEPQETKEISMRKPFFDKKNRKLTPAEIGTAHHMFMQFADFGKCQNTDGIKSECVRLSQNRIMTTEQIDAVDIGVINSFFSSELYENHVSKGKLYREFKFSVLVPAMDYYEQAKNTPEQKVLLQGVIDCLVETENGFHIIDFKTDRVSKEKSLERAKEYKSQLDAYSKAVEMIFDKPVIQKSLWFFVARKCVEV